MKKALIILVALLVLIVGGVAVFVSTVDVNNYRPQIAEALSKQTGRSVKLNGAIKLTFSLQGFKFEIADVTISNPSWAHAPQMASIGHFGLGVAVMPLLNKQVSITGIDIDGAKIDLETNASGQHSWDMVKTVEPEKERAPTKSTAAPVDLRVGHVTITNSALSMRDESGKVTNFKIDSMKLGMEGAGAAVHLVADFNGTPIKADITTGLANFLAPKGTWPFGADLEYANFKVTAEGKADLDKKAATINSYAVTSGATTLRGELVANWGGSRPSLRGTMNSEHLNPTDFQPAPSSKTITESAQQPEGARRMFSNDPLPLDGLKSANVDMDIKIGEFPVAKGVLKDITTKLVLNNSVLTIAPFKAKLGSGDIGMNVKLNGATSPAQLAFSANAPDVLMEDLLNMVDAPKFVSGRASANINLSSSGNSMHGLASNAVGVMDVVAAGGNVSSTAAREVSSPLMELIAPGGSNALNCAAVRFIVKNGVAQDNGILADTAVTTVAGKGGFDLGQETINLLIRAKSKHVNVGGLVPPLKIAGNLAAPSFHVDPTETVQNVASLLTGSGLGTNTVPDITAAPAGQNACVYTIDHPPAATATKSVLPSSITGKVGEKLNNVGGMLKGFLGN
jgi:uncharacterized protein involved in outer membrane biogenesis